MRPSSLAPKLMCSTPKSAVSVSKASACGESFCYCLEKEKRSRGGQACKWCQSDGPGVTYVAAETPAAAPAEAEMDELFRLPGTGLSSQQFPRLGLSLCSCSFYFFPLIPSFVFIFLPQDSCMWESWILSHYVLSLAWLHPTFSSCLWPLAAQWRPCHHPRLAVENSGPRISAISRSELTLPDPRS